MSPMLYAASRLQRLPGLEFVAGFCPFKFAIWLMAYIAKHPAKHIPGLKLTPGKARHVVSALNHTVPCIGLNLL